MQHSVHGPLRPLCVLPSLFTMPAPDLHSIFDLTSPANALVWRSCATPFRHGDHSQTPTFSDVIPHASPLENVDPPRRLRSSRYTSVVIVVVWAVHTPSQIVALASIDVLGASARSLLPTSPPSTHYPNRHLSCQGLLERPTRAWFCDDKWKKMRDLEWEAENNRKQRQKEELAGKST